MILFRLTDSVNRIKTGDNRLPNRRHTSVGVSLIQVLLETNEHLADLVSTTKIGHGIRNGVVVPKTQQGGGH